MSDTKIADEFSNVIDGELIEPSFNKTKNEWGYSPEQQAKIDQSLADAKRREEDRKAAELEVAQTQEEREVQAQADMDAAQVKREADELSAAEDRKRAEKNPYLTGGDVVPPE